MKTPVQKLAADLTNSARVLLRNGTVANLAAGVLEVSESDQYRWRKGVQSAVWAALSQMSLPRVTRYDVRRMRMVLRGAR